MHSRGRQPSRTAAMTPVEEKYRGIKTAICVVKEYRSVIINEQTWVMEENFGIFLKKKN